MNTRRPAANHVELTADLLATAARAALEQPTAETFERLGNAVEAYESAREGKTCQTPIECRGSGCKYWNGCQHEPGEDCFFPLTVRSSIPGAA